MNISSLSAATYGSNIFLPRSVYRLIAVVVLLVMFPCTLVANNPVKTQVHYKVSSTGLSIGEVTTTQRTTEESGIISIHFETRTAVSASFLWMGYALDTVEKGTIQKGELISYSRKGRENGAVIDVEGHLEHSTFRLDVRENGVTRSISIPRSSYDFTTMECPEARIDFTEKPRVTLKVLDVEKLAVVRREYQLVRTAHYKIAGKEYPCRVVDFSDQNKSARRWVFWDGSAVVMYRQDGKGDKSSYSVQATSVSRDL
ncbi:MAG: hypothetical protein WCP10_14215 [Desulfuromonadales bacterium]